VLDEGAELAVALVDVEREVVVAVLADQPLPPRGRLRRRCGRGLLLLVGRGREGDLVALAGDLESPVVGVVGDEVLAELAQPDEVAAGVREQVEFAEALDEVDPAVVRAPSSHSVAAGECTGLFR
jgi:hypothetical protein